MSDDNKFKLRAFEIILSALLTVCFGMAIKTMDTAADNSRDLVNHSARIKALEGRRIPPIMFEQQVHSNTKAIKELSEKLVAQNERFLERLHAIETELAKLTK